MEEVRACCDKAQILPFIEGLPEQWETKVPESVDQSLVCSTQHNAQRARPKSRVADTHYPSQLLRLFHSFSLSA
jgi:hypothetical protein